MGKIRNTRSESGSDIVCLEGNGSRPSHHGDGYKESGVMFTLNTTEAHAVAYGIEPGAVQRLDPTSRIWKECSPTLRANAGDNQASVAICREDERKRGARYLLYQETIGALCATDYKWVQQEQVMQGKLIVYESDKHNDEHLPDDKRG